MKATRTNLGAVLRLYRSVHDIDLRTLALEIGTSHATLMRIEHGAVMDLATWLKIQAWLLATRQ